jgi:hypothetical protein
VIAEVKRHRQTIFSKALPVRTTNVPAETIMDTITLALRYQDMV